MALVFVVLVVVVVTGVEEVLVWLVDELSGVPVMVVELVPLVVVAVVVELSVVVLPTLEVLLAEVVLVALVVALVVVLVEGVELVEELVAGVAVTARHPPKPKVMLVFQLLGEVPILKTWVTLVLPVEALQALTRGTGVAPVAVAVIGTQHWPAVEHELLAAQTT